LEKTNGIFLGAGDTQIIKSSSMFWEHLFIYPSSVQEYGNDCDFIDLVQPLFEQNILKIISDPSDFSKGLSDKIYYSIDRDFWNFLEHNSSQICHTVELSSEEQSLSENDAEIDVKNTELKQIFENDLKSSLTQDLEKEVENSLGQRFGNIENSSSKKLKNEITSTLTNVFSSIHKSLWDKQLLLRYNRELFTQLHVSSSIFSDKFQRRYYKLKLGDAYNDNSKYLSGVNSLLPIVQRETISDFSIDEIIQLRKNPKWNKAMVELTALCDKAKHSPFTEDFEKELTQNVFRQYQDQLDQSFVTRSDFVKELGTTSSFIGISMIPVIGGVISGGLTLAHQISNYLIAKRNQKTLPLFLNDVRKKDL